LSSPSKLLLRREKARLGSGSVIQD
jgi:hypothetical protein